MITRTILAVICAAAAAAAMLMGSSSPALAEKRLAMVVGINSYPTLGADAQLQRAVSDADAVSGSLKRLGFSVTTLSGGMRVTHDAFLKKFSSFLQEIQPGDIAVFYFAGHGFMLGQENYLVPADMPDFADTDQYIVRDHALAETDLRARIRERGPRVVLLMLDACRNNPFHSTDRALPFSRGLQPVAAAQGVLTIYAAGYGQSALDRLSDTDDPNPNSVFTRVVVEELSQPGVNLLDFSEDVRDKVASLARSVGYVQVPAVDNELIGGRSMYLGPPPAIAPPPPAGPGPDEIAWTYVGTSTDVTTLRRFVSDFPTSRRRQEAQDRLASLEARNENLDRKSAPTAPTVAPPPDVEAWEAVATSEAPSEIRAFMDRFPASPLRVEAEKRLASLDEATWRSVAGEDGSAHQHYLDLFPQGSHAAQARTAVADLARAKVEHDTHLADDGLWTRTSKADAAAQRHYLALFPEGSHASQARSLLARLEQPALRSEAPALPPRPRVISRHVGAGAILPDRAKRPEPRPHREPVRSVAERPHREPQVAEVRQHRSCFVFAGESHCQ